MKPLKDIKEAIIKIDDGSLNVVLGKDLNTFNIGYHNRLVFETHNGGNEILIKGYKGVSKSFSETITDKNKNFDFYCKNLVGFQDRVCERKRFSWKQFKFVPEKYVFFSWNMPYSETKFLYKEDLWKKVEYKANNWVFEEI